MTSRFLSDVQPLHPGERQAITALFGARELRQFNAGP